MKGFSRAFMNVFRLLLAVLLGFSASVVQAQRVDQLPKPTDYVSDYAHVLSPETIARLDRICSQLDHSAANSQVAIVTVQTLDGQESDDYANELENKWKIGRKGSDRGVLILLAVGDHKRRIDVGFGLEGILPDGRLGDIGREMVPQLRSNDFDGAVTLAVDEIAQIIAADAKVTLNEEPVPAGQPVRRVHHGSGMGKLILLVIILIFFGGSWLFRLLFGIGLFSSWMGGGRYGGGGWGGGFGGGGFGGGAGGDSGGGGGGFGGFGGGSFGGGGAGGDW
ncbi:MAG: TPM domain-containing protein [Terracidiphilus sp.]